MKRGVRLATIGVVCALAAVCIAVGIANGEVQRVFIKAVNICFECIGLG